MEEIKNDSRPDRTTSWEVTNRRPTVLRRVNGWRVHQKPFAANDRIISRNSAGPTPRDEYGFSKTDADSEFN